jgi:hypothetical protein
MDVAGDAAWVNGKRSLHGCTRCASMRKRHGPGKNEAALGGPRRDGVGSMAARAPRHAQQLPARVTGDTAPLAS